jgi:CHAT domain-containing protein/tetratricopeptide (TPR) repeat protein
MRSICGTTFALCALLLSGLAAAAAPRAASCAAPADKLLRRFDLEVPGATRLTRSVDVPAAAEIVVEAFEKGLNARLEVTAPDGTVSAAESGLHRWPPHRVIVPAGPARRVDVTVIGLEREHGRVDVQISRVDARRDPRCAEFLRTMAAGDAAFSRGAMISRGELELPEAAPERDYATAADAYARAALILGAGGADEAQAQLVRASTLMDAAHRFPEALEAAIQGEARFEALGDVYGRSIARFLRAYSLTYDAMSTQNAAEATRKFESARDMFIELAAGHERRGERFEQALALDGLGCTNGFLFRYAEAINSYKRVLELFEQLHETDRAVAIRQNLAYFEIQFGHYQEALKRHLEILAEGDAVKDPVAFTSNLRNAAWLEVELGQYDVALRHYSDAYARSLRTHSEGSAAWALYGLGHTYHAIGNYAEALRYLDRSLELHSGLKRARDVAVTLRTQATVLADMGRSREAIQRREEALRNAQIPPEKARITLELVDDRIKAGDFTIAKSLIASLLGARDLPDPNVRVGATLASARIALAEGDAMSALRDASTAAEYYRSHELVSAEFAALMVQARAACAAHARDKALDFAESALQRAEEIRTFSSNPTLRASLWRPVRPAFGLTIGLLARADTCGSSTSPDPLGALAIAESSRSRALGDFRLRSSTDSAAQSQASGRRRELFEQLAGARQQLEGLSGAATVNDERVKSLVAEIGRLRREIDLTGGLPDASRARAVDLRPALRARIDAIPQDTAVVEYWIGEQEAFAWLLTRGRAQLVDLGPAVKINDAARRMYDAMHGWITGSVEARISRSRELHALVIAPLPAELHRARTVYFIPDGMLHAVPFAALADRGGQKDRFFIDSHDVAVAPSFLAIAYDSELRALARKSSALVVVDPVYAADDARFTETKTPLPATPVAAITLRGSKTWTRLPATAREAATISKLLGRNAVQVLSGFDANRDTLLGRDLSSFDILHFATHAVADTEAPQLSALVLSTVDAKGRPRIGEVFAGDLADQHLDARLVVLSGCETALGRAEAGEGLLGLRYAAHASGARAVVASLWPVEDAAGARLMDDLYADVIGHDASPVTALSRAERAARTRWKDPALWAAFDVSVAGF